MSFLLAFVFGGALCAIAQALLMLTPLKPPHILNLFLGLGGLLMPFGLTAWLSETGGGGFNSFICGAGTAFETAATLAVYGNAFMLVIVMLLFFVTVMIGIATGEIRHRLEEKTANPRNDARSRKPRPDQTHQKTA